MLHIHKCTHIYYTMYLLTSFQYHVNCACGSLFQSQTIDTYKDSNYCQMLVVAMHRLTASVYIAIPNSPVST